MAKPLKYTRLGWAYLDKHKHNIYTTEIQDTWLKEENKEKLYKNKKN